MNQPSASPNIPNTPDASSAHPLSSPNRLPQSPFTALLVDNGGPIFPPADEKFNWGAFFLGFIHALFHRQYKVAGVLLGVQIVLNVLSQSVPYVGFVSLPVMLILNYLYGKVGYRAACLGKDYGSAEELYQREQKYTLIGVVFFVLSILVLGLTIGFFVYALMTGGN